MRYREGMRVSRLFLTESVRNPATYELVQVLTPEEKQALVNEGRLYFELEPHGVLVAGEYRRRGTEDDFIPRGALIVPWGNIKSVDLEVGDEPAMPDWTRTPAKKGARPMVAT